MGAHRKIRIKICCIGSIDEARTAIDYGASALGLVSEMPSGPGVISEQEIVKIRKVIHPSIEVFLLTSKIEGAQIIAQYELIKPTVLQFVDKISVEKLKKFKKLIPQVSLIPVIHVVDESAVKEALFLSEYADAVLLDSGNPNLSVKELGGTGKVHNWEISRRIREKLNIPVYLAGGLRAANVRAAIEKVEPFGVDVCSGVRTEGQLDKQKLKNFFKETEGWVLS